MCLHITYIYLHFNLRIIIGSDGLKIELKVFLFAPLFLVQELE